MKFDFNSIFRSKLFKFIIVLVVIILSCIGYYKNNKKKIDDTVVFLYNNSKDNDNLDKEEINYNEENIKKKKKESENKVIFRKNKTKKWVDSKNQEYKEILRRAEKAKRQAILEKYNLDKPVSKEKVEENLKTFKNRLEKNAKEYSNFQNLLKNEYDRKKAQGRIYYNKKTKSNDYIYATMDTNFKDKEVQKKVNARNKDKKPMYFVIHIDSSKEKEFNRKLLNKKINDVVYLELEDFLSEDKKKQLRDLKRTSQEAVDKIAEANKYLKDINYQDSLRKAEFSYKIKIIDILDNDFVQKNKINEKIFDYNK